MDRWVNHNPPKLRYFAEQHLKAVTAFLCSYCFSTNPSWLSKHPSAKHRSSSPCNGDITQKQRQPLEAPKNVRSVYSMLVCSFPGYWSKFTHSGEGKVERKKKHSFSVGISQVRKEANENYFQNFFINTSRVKQICI